MRATTTSTQNPYNWKCCSMRIVILVEDEQRQARHACRTWKNTGALSLVSTSATIPYRFDNRPGLADYRLFKHALRRIDRRLQPPGCGRRAPDFGEWTTWTSNASQSASPPQ